MSSDLNIHGVDTSSGKGKWVNRTNVAPLHVAPVIYEDRLFVPAGSSIYNFRLRSGVRGMTTFVRTITYEQSDKQVDGDINTTLIVTSDPEHPAQANAGLFFFGDKSGNFYCGTFKGVVRWKVPLVARPAAMPVLTGDIRDPNATLYIGTEQGFIYALRARDGAILWTFRPLPPRDFRVQYAHTDFTAPLVADKGQLLVLGDDGTLLCLTKDAVDASPPEITGPVPARGAAINGTPPLRFGVYMWDEGSGVNPDTVAVFLDGQQQPMSEGSFRTRGIRPGVVYDPDNRKVWFTTTPGKEGQREEPMPNGRHTVKVQAADWKGNMATMEWSFVVDNSLPVPKRTTTTTTGRPGAGPGMRGPGAPGGTAGQYGPGAYGGTANPSTQRRTRTRSGSRAPASQR
jgi:outer membrane protein assembly factor BamB